MAPFYFSVKTKWSSKKFNYKLKKHLKNLKLGKRMMTVIVKLSFKRRKLQQSQELRMRMKKVMMILWIVMMKWKIMEKKRLKRKKSFIRKMAKGLFVYKSILDCFKDLSLIVMSFLSIHKMKEMNLWKRIWFRMPCLDKSVTLLINRINFSEQL